MNRIIVIASVSALVGAPLRTASAAVEKPSEYVEGNTVAPSFGSERGRNAEEAAQAERRDLRIDASVSPSGTLVWSQPLEAVSGQAGLQPELRVTYDSGAENGLLGPGFELAGLPAIVRVPGTDGGATANAEPRGRIYDGHDSFAFAPDGFGTPISPQSRLVANADGDAYHTAIENWWQFSAHGNCGLSGFAPCTWVAEDGHGTRYVFGNSSDARLWSRDGGEEPTIGPGSVRGVAVWALSHIQDKHGNVMSVHYLHDDRFMLYPDEIQYGCPTTVSTPPVADRPTPGELVPPPIPTPGVPSVPTMGVDPNGSTTPSTPTVTFPAQGVTNPWVTVSLEPPTPSVTIGSPTATPACTSGRSVKFRYDTREDLTAMPSRYDRRLSSVTMRSKQQAVRSYAFAYELDPSPSGGLSRLSSITEIGDDSLTTRRPTTFVWSDGTGLDPDTKEARSWAFSGGDEPVLTRSGDVNGDGKADIVRLGFSSYGRTVSYALGQDAPLEQSTAPLGPIETFPLVDGDHDHWSAAVVDINVDGHDDVVMWGLSKGVGEMVLHMGSATGLEPAKDYPYNADLTAFAGAGHGSSFYIARVADVNGDQVPDIVFTNRHEADTLRIAYALGSDAGLGPLSFVHGAAVKGPTEVLPPIINDVDGNGVDDVVMSFVRTTGVTTQVFRGTLGGLLAGEVLGWAPGVDTADCPGGCLPGEAICSCVGLTPFQSLRTDINGDGVGDITLAYTGEQRDTTIAVSKPFGRHIETWLGQTDFDQLPKDAVGRLNDAPVHQILDGADYPYHDLNAPNHALWEHHSADVNGDGFSDVLSVYSGVGGARAAFAIGTPTGDLSPMITVSDCAASSDHKKFGDPCSSWPDGDHSKHRWHSIAFDANEDGYDDLLRFYAGSQGRAVHVSWGSPTGLSKFEEFLKGPPVPEVSGKEADIADAVSLLMPDLNGDGRPDVVLASHDEVLLLGSDPGTPATPAHPNLLTQISNGYGGVVDINYESSARLPGAIDTAATTCGGTTGSECGTAQRRPRALVVSTTKHDGRGDDRTSAYAYQNGRYYPGPVIVDLARTRPHERADLLFETVERTDDWSRLRTLTRYDQSADLSRKPIEVVESAAIHQAGGGYAGHGVSRRIEFEFDRRNTPFGTTAVELVNRRERTFESNGFQSADTTRVYEHGTHGGIVRDTECADGECIETEFVLDPPTVMPGDYRVQRLRDEKRRVPGQGDVISWTHYDYTGDVLEDELALLCGDAEQCSCYSDVSQCIASGEGDWVTIRGSMDYDAYGNLTSVLDGEGSETRYEYDADLETFLSAVERDVTRPDGSILTHRREMTYDAAGRLENDIDENGNMTTTRYDAVGRVDEVEYPNGRLAEFTHPNSGDPSLQRTRVEYETNATTGDRYFEESFYDGMGRVHMRRRSMGDDVAVQHWGWSYASDHDFEMVSDPYLESEMGAHLWTETTRDPRGRILEVRRHRGSLFEANSTVLGVLERYLYVSTGFSHWTNAAQVEDDGTILGEDLRWRFVSTDSRDRITGISEDGGIETTYFYDQALRPRLVWGRHASTSVGPIYDETFLRFYYDTLGRKIMVHDTHGLVSLQYDDNGNLLQSNDANGDAIDWSYDELGRVTRRSTATTDDEYTYDQGVNGMGRLHSVTGAWGTRSFPQGYDVGGHPNALQVELAGLPSALTETYQYETSGNMTRRTLPDSTVLEYSHDGSGMLRTVTVDQFLYAEFDQYDAHGSPAFRETPASITTFEYDADHRLMTLQAEGQTGELLQEYGYEYNAAGDVLALVDRRIEAGSSIPGDASWTYAYDRLGQLTEAEDGYGNAFDFAYDSQGHLRQKGDLFLDPGHRDLVVREGSATGAVLSEVTLDDMGRIVSKSDGRQWQYVRDPLGRLTEVQLENATLMTADYAHDDTRVRRTEQVNGVDVTTWYVTPNFEVRHSSDEPGVFRATKRVDAGSMGTLATLTDAAISGGASVSTALAAWGTDMDPNADGAPEGVYFMHSNHLGSTDVVTNGDGEPVSVYATSPWGERTSDSHGFDVADREFTGQVRDETVGLLYYQSRYYDPVIGQFLEADYAESREPYIPGGIFDPRGLNRHAYVFNNPVRYNDPTGHKPEFYFPAEDAILIGAGVENAAKAIARVVKVDASIGWTLGPYAGSCNTSTGCGLKQDSLAVGANKSLTVSKSVQRGVLRGAAAATIKKNGVSASVDVGVGREVKAAELGATVGTSVSVLATEDSRVEATVAPRARVTGRLGTKEANLSTYLQVSLREPLVLDVTPNTEGLVREKPMP